MLTDTIKPAFSEELRGRICEAVLEHARNAVARANDRDEDFLRWARQAEGDPLWAGMPPRWLGGCDIEDPLTDEHLFEIVASLCYIQRQQDWFQVTEVEDAPDSAQTANYIEGFLNDVVVETRLNTEHLYDLAENAARYSYGVLAVEWEQKFDTRYLPIYREKNTGNLFSPDAPEVLANPDDFTLTEEVEETLTHNGPMCRVPYTGDVYLDPPTSQSFKQAERVLERFEYTAQDLLNGISDFGFDEDRVREMLIKGPTASTDRTYRSERDEIEGMDGNEDTWEVFRVIGTPPTMLTEGRSDLKESERRRDYQWFICPSHDVCFKFAPSPFAKRPYAKYPFRGRPGRMVGHSVCTMLAPLQQETTSSFRFGIDFRDLYMSSPLFVPDVLADKLDQFETFPGARIPYPTNIPLPQNPIWPLPFNPQGFAASMANLNDQRGRASQLFSADARGPAQIQNRTATEISQAASGADEKLDLILMNFHMGVEETGDLFLSHFQQFAPGEIVRKIGQKAVTITQDMLKRQFRIQATGSSENTSPVVKLHRAELVASFAAKDPIIASAIAKGDMTGIHALLSYLYRAAGVRNPEKFIGPEPSAPPNADYLLQMLLQVAAQYAQQGDPGCQYILQQAQQVMRSMPPQAQGGAQDNGAKPKQDAGASVSIKYEDLAPNQRAAFAQQNMNLPPPEQPQPMNPYAAMMNGNGVR